MAAVNKKANDLITIAGGVYKTAQVKAWKISVTTALTDDVATNGILTTSGTSRAVMRELGSTAMMFQVTDNGKDIIVVGDSHALDADSLEARVNNVVGANEVTAVAEITDFVGITATS
jgi:hypothetical protein